METQVRIFRENPIAWWDKPVMRYLRKKYGHNKRLFVSLRGVYLALCEIESDFVETPINFFTATVGTYAGVTREVAGRCIKILEEENLVTRTRIKDEKTNRFITGTVVVLKVLKSDTTVPEPMPRIASNGDRQQRGSWASIKKISTNKKVSMNKNNVRQQPVRSRDEAQYYAQNIAEKLRDTKSLSFYTQACLRHDPTRLLQKAHEIVADGAARNPGAVFVKWLQTLEKGSYRSAADGSAASR
jgi:hypothetical protein